MLKKIISCGNERFSIHISRHNLLAVSPGFKNQALGATFLTRDAHLCLSIKYIQQQAHFLILHHPDLNKEELSFPVSHHKFSIVQDAQEINPVFYWASKDFPNLKQAIRHGVMQLVSAQSKPQDAQQDSHSSSSPEKISVEDWESYIKHNHDQIIFYTGAGISADANLPLLSDYPAYLGFNPKQSSLENLNTLLRTENLKGMISNLYERFSSPPTQVHDILSQISRYSDTWVLTENQDFLAEQTQTDVIRVRKDGVYREGLYKKSNNTFLSNFRDINWGRKSTIVTVGMSSDQSGLLKHFKSINPLNKVIAINPACPRGPVDMWVNDTALRPLLLFLKEKMTSHWASYIHRIPTDRLRGPNEWLKQTLLHYGAHYGTALDLGAGAGYDTAFLLHKGFRYVVAVEPIQGAEERFKMMIRHPNTIDHIGALDEERLDWRQQLFREVADLPSCDLVNATVSLNFTTSFEFDHLWSSVRKSLAPGGIFSCSVFTEQCPWAQSTPNHFYPSLEKIKELFEGNGDYSILDLKVVDETDLHPSQNEGGRFEKAYIVARRTGRGIVSTSLSK